MFCTCLILFRYQCSWPHFAGELSFYNVDKSMAGEYVCTATVDDTFQSPISASITITVGRSPVIVTRPRDQTVRVGQTVYINCEATGDPVPTIKWDKNDNFLKDLSPRVKVRISRIFAS